MSNQVISNEAQKSTSEEGSTGYLMQDEHDFAVGDTIVIHSKIREDDRTRIQKYEGIVIAIKGKERTRTVTVRRISSNDVGVERIFPVYSPNIVRIEIKRKGKVRRSKLYYLRERTGRAATYIKAAN